MTIHVTFELTDEQRAKIEAINAEFKKQLGNAIAKYKEKLQEQNDQHLREMIDAYHRPLRPSWRIKDDDDAS